MPFESLSAFVALVLAVSLAAERLVKIAKTFNPKWLGKEKTAQNGTEDPVADKWRRLAVQGLAILAACATAAFLTDGKCPWVAQGNSCLWNPIGSVKINADLSVPALIIGLLASGGSAFWNEILGYTRAVKDIKDEQSAEARRMGNR